MNYFEWIPSALAQQSTAAPGAATGSSGIMGMVAPMIVVFAIFYFLIIRPQRKRDSDHQKFLGSLAKGDEVVTQSGLLGKVVGIADKVVTLEISQNVKVKVLKPTILQKIDQNFNVQKVDQNVTSTNP